MRRPSRYRRPGMSVSAVKSLLLSASGGNVVLKAAPDTTTSIDLTWTAAVPKPDDYRIERSTDGITFSTVTTVTSSTTTYNDTGRTESTRYWYRIIPVLNSVDQASSNIANTWTVPSTPTGLTATAISSTQIDLAWTDVSTGNTAQSIQRRSPAGSGSYSFIASVGATANSYSDTGLTLATQYEYQVAATNPATQSAWSTAANATTTGGGPPSASWTLDFSTGTTYSDLVLTRASTGTYVDSSGYIASASTDIARLTHDSSGSRLGLLVEGQRANLILASGTVGSGGGWAGSNLTLGTTTTAPDNTNTGRRFVENTAANAPHHYYQGATVGDCTCSIYAKKDQRDFLTLSIWVAVNNYAAATFDLANGTAGSIVYGTAPTQTVSSATARIEDAGNGWYRCIVSGVKTSGLTYLWFATATQASPSLDSYASQTYTGSTSNGLFVWGAQLEAGATPSTYIPTTTASVTRSADLAYVDTADVTNWGRPGSFVVEYYKPLEQSGGVVVADDDGVGNAGRLGLEYSAGGPRIVYGTSGAGSGGTDSAGLNKVGWAWDGSGAATRSALNGSALDTSLATSFDPTLTDGINLGGNIDWSTLPLTVSGQPNVVIRRVRFWNSQLSAADLNTLTT